MPISIGQVVALTSVEVLGYLPRLRELHIDIFDAEYILRSDDNTLAWEDTVRIDAIRSLIIRERHRLSPIESPPVIQSSSVRISVVDSNGVEHPLSGFSNVGLPSRESGVFISDAWNRGIRNWAGSFSVPQLPVSYEFPVHLVLDGTEEEGLLRRRQRAWEIAFLKEEEYTDFPKVEVSAKKYEGVSVLEDKRKFVGYTLKKIAEMLPAGLLGVHTVDGVPYNLLYRAERVDDPRKKILKGTEWREVRGVEKVLWSPATLEAYNVLDDTGLEYEPTARLRNWLKGVSSPNPLASTLPGEWFDADCPLFDYQRDSVKFMVARDRAILSLSPGLGKSLVSSYSAGMTSAKKVLLVCPASLLYYWMAELDKWDMHLPLHPLAEVWHKQVGTVPGFVPHDSQFWAVTNPETLVRFDDEFKGKFDLLIADESIMYKHKDSIRSQKMNGVARTINKVWLLTGAPATRYLDDMWHQFHILNNRGYSSYWRFAERYCFVEDEVWAKSVVANKKGAEEEIKKNFADIYFSRNQEQVADIPDWLFEDIDIPMRPKQDSIYSKLRKELRVVIEGYPSDYVLKVNDRMSLVLRSLQVASNPVLLGSDNSSGKWSALPELMNIYPGPYLVWVNFIRTGEMIKDMLVESFGEERVNLANGSTSMKDRNSMVNMFQAGGYDAFVLNSAVGKFGFTLTKARTAFFLERDYNDSYFQCLYRNRRIGTTESPVVVNMRSVTLAGSRTIDHVVHDALDYRTGMIKKITMGDLLDVLED